MYLTMPFDVVISLLAFMAFKWAIQTIHNLDIFALFLLFFAIHTIYKNTTMDSYDPPPCSRPVSIPNNTIAPGTHGACVYSEYLTLLHDLVPALEAIEGCIAQLKGREELLEQFTAASRITLTLMYRRLEDQVVQSSNDMRALENMVCRAGLDDIKQGLQALTRTVSQLSDRADGVDATIEGHAQDIATIQNDFNGTNLMLQTSSQRADNVPTSLCDLRAELAHAIASASAPTTLSERLDEMESDHNLKLGELMNAMTSIEVQQHKQIGQVQEEFRAELQTAKNQFSASKARSEDALREYKKVFDEELVRQSRMFSEKSDSMHQKNTRLLHDELKQLRGELDGTEFRHNLDMQERNSAFDGSLAEQQFLTDMMRKDYDSLHDRVSSLHRKLRVLESRYEQGMTDHKTSSQEVWEQQIECLTVKIQQLGEVHQNEMKSLMEQIGQRNEAQARHDDASTRMLDALGVNPMTVPSHDESRSEGDKSACETSNVTRVDRETTRSEVRGEGKRYGGAREGDSTDASSCSNTDLDLAQTGPPTLSTTSSSFDGVALDNVSLDSSVQHVAPTSSSSPASSTAPSIAAHGLPDGTPVEPSSFRTAILRPDTSLPHVKSTTLNSAIDSERQPDPHQNNADESSRGLEPLVSPNGSYHDGTAVAVISPSDVGVQGRNSEAFKSDAAFAAQPAEPARPGAEKQTKKKRSKKEKRRKK